MPRIRTINLDDGLQLAIAPLSYAEVDKYVKETAAMAERKASAEEFTGRLFRIVSEALNKPDQRFGGAPQWDVARVKRELDRPSIDKLHAEVLAMSGLSRAAEI
jgi:hypothetical protein